MYFGVHVSIAGGFERALERAVALNCRAAQIFTASCRRWHAPPIAAAAAARFRTLRARTPLRTLVAHAGYLANLASPDRALRQRSLRACREELHRCAQLGLDGLVLHPGCHGGDGRQRGLERLARSIEALGASLEATPLLLENTAGQGTSLGFRLEELVFLADRFPPPRVGFCLDTCHLHAAGYDLSTAAGVRGALRAVEETIGLARVRLLHLNDSAAPAGSRRDRHAGIGEGTIGLAGFRALVRDARLRAVAAILETPKGRDGGRDRLNLERLRALAAGRRPPAHDGAPLGPDTRAR